MKKLPFKIRLSRIQILAVGFLVIIAVGTVLLSLPIATKSREPTPIIDAMFTSFSATCVTGLSIYDTYTHWSLFGQTVILLLIQVGGLGFMSMAVLLSMLAGKRINLRERELMREAISSIQLGGIVRLTRHIFFGTLFFEGAGAILLAFRFCPDMGFARGIYNAIFHSVSAFCNAGFDLMGFYEPFSSLDVYATDVLVNIVLMVLVVVGGIGFLVWEDIYTYKLKFKRYRLHTKIVLSTTAVLIVVPAIIFFFVEWDNTLHTMGVGHSIMASFFQSISTRTAGFSTINTSTLLMPTTFIMVILMVIGGSSGSTAGGIKTTTFAMLVMSTLAVIRGRDSIQVYGRRLEFETLRRATAVSMLYLGVAAVATTLLGILEHLSLQQSMFEVVSAMSTVGLDLSLAATLGDPAKILVSFLMYFGRVGVLSVVLSFTRAPIHADAQYPREKIIIG